MSRSQRMFGALVWLAAILCAVGIGALPSQTGPAEPGPTESFEKSISMIVVKNCLECHNPADPKGGLDLTRRETLLKGGDSGPVVSPGKPEESFLIERVAEGSMPPPKKGKRLSPDEVAALRAWIKAGAVWPADRVLSPFELTTARRAGYDWWSFQPVVRPPVPSVRQSDWTRNPVDSFVLRQLETKGFGPAPAADKITFIRRVTYDLVGLPPTPKEIDEYVQDGSPEADEKLIDRMLASPHYGERWGRHWLDVARYGESDGFENDKLRDHAWHYRDYVIRSFNADKPYPQFIREQLAGDVLEPITRDGLIASGFLVAGPWDEVQNVGKSKSEKMRTHEEQLEELIGAVSQTFLGITVNCARCHDHKFDPVPQSDYYRIKAVFDGVDHGNRPLLTPDELRIRDVQVQPIQARIRELKSGLQELRNAEPADAKVRAKEVQRLLTEGRFGQALDARQGHAETIAKPRFHQPPISVECWARLFSSGGFNILAADNPKESAEHWELYTYAGTGALSAYFPGYTPSEIKSTVNVTDEKWHHLAMSFDGAMVKLYVDARLVQETAVVRNATVTMTDPGSLYIGAYPPHKIRCDGIVDELRISNVCRTPESVPEIPFVADPQTLGLWHFDRLGENEFTDAAGAATPPSADHAERKQELTARLKEKEEELKALAVPLVYSGVRVQPEPTVVFLRGEIDKPGPAVTPGGLSSVRAPAAEIGLSNDAPEAERRLHFANWVADPDHPLTARVIVNRIWQYHFGQGLIETPNDFGFNGGHPTHPELLDWLAAEFVHPCVARSEAQSAIGWSVKRLHKLILSSATYRQSSAFQPRAAEVDSDDRLLWRFAPRRLEAETARDAMLAVSGELNPQIGGPSFRPFKVTVFLTHFYHLFDSPAPEFNRRTVYRANVNTGKSPLLDALDCPAPSVAAPKRRNTTTTLQALSLMNDSFVLRQAERFASRVERTAPANRGAQVALAYRFALGRDPSATESMEGIRLAEEHGLESVCWVLLNSSEFLYIR